ncbi:MAG: 4-hydroxy-tetrahydrodipicolinate synthase [Oscillospiraceae bacterium]|nr:4-hydroxy-tetrahydrodipicolinate synthase [Oscillospiraceae bacterium]
MAKTTIFEGAATALITPFKDGQVDYPALKKLIDWQIEEGIDALVICGTTGEGSTMTDAEHKEVLRFSLEAAAGRVPMIAGTGSNDTAYAIQMTQHACEMGYDGVLVVTPYYNKATQNGLVAHYTAIAEASTKPVIVYNVPGRTGVSIAPATYAKMSKVPNLTAIKEANGNISSVVETATLVGDAMDIYSGNDDQIVPIMACGGKGVISVLSNVLPKETSEMCRKMREGDVLGAMEMQKKYLALTNALFSEVNPIPVKAAMAAMGFCENSLRLPLTPMEEAHEQHLLACMREVGLKV